MKPLQFLLVSCQIVFILGCSSSERPEYFLADSQLRTLQGGDSNTYAVLDANSAAGNLVSYTETLSPKTLFAPDSSSMEILVESFVQDGSVVYPFVSRMFRQDDDGNLILLGISRSGEHYWLMDNISDVGKILLPSDLSSLTNPLIISSALKFCENQICDTRGQINVRLEPLGIETIETRYADFESYKFSLQWDINLFDSNNANNSVSQSLIKEGTRQWIHPAIGVVKFIYEVSNDTQLTTLFGNLNQTNISIPERYKR